jgi:branched-chain amino acid transport system permease protein
MLPYLVIGIFTGASYALLAVSFVLIYKGTRIFNLAQGEIGGMGVYIAWTLVGTVPVFLASIIGIAAAAALGLVIEVGLVRRLVNRTPLAALAAMLGVALVLAYGEVRFFGLNVKTFPSPVGLAHVSVGSVLVTAPRIAALVCAAAVAGGLALFLRKTRFGLAVEATTSNAELARLSGVPVERVRAFIWALGGAVSALAAILLATVSTFYPLSTTLWLIPAVVAALLGGLTSLPGAFVGGLAIGVVESLTVWRTSIGGAADATMLVLLLIGLLLRPQGVLGGRAS